MRAMDIMTTAVITVGPDTSVQDLAKLLSDRAISGAPVVDANNRLVGIVSEGDLLHRAETGTERRVERRRSRWLDSLAADRDLARDYIKSHAGKVADIMTRKVITVDETAALGDVANLLETNKIKRVPVLRAGQLVGIVSRANLVRALAVTPIQPVGDGDDHAMRAKLLAELGHQEWAHVWAADIIVRDKVVHLWFSDDRPEEERQAVRIAAENVPGVRAVEEHTVPAPIIPAF
ncbi:MAG TPA: CBS domain-containing protein [Stellaceae bacterium]|nr:CBS domain-containing protein [Stellaceae bacterium]